MRALIRTSTSATDLLRGAALLAALVAVLGVVVAPRPAGAHTDADLVAVPAGAEATLTLKPTHGCGDSPTVEVAIQAPVPGAVAGEVEGWTASSTDDGAGHTVLEWTGGSLPTDRTGSFPVTFTAPDAVGELLVFPSVQVCEDGGELAWIDGDPEGEYPAPRILVLPADAEPATAIDDVPADAPGRDQLRAIVDVDAPGATTSTTTAASDPTVVAGGDDAGTSTTLEETDTPPVGDTETEADPDDEGDSIAGAVVIAAVVVLVVGGAAALVITRRRRA